MILIKLLNNLHKMDVQSIKLKRVSSGKYLKLINIKFKNKLEIKLLNIGCALVSLKLPIPDSNNFVDPILAHKHFEDYIKNIHYLGIIIGRWANRIKNGTFNLGDKKIILDKNWNNHTIHGGVNSIGHKIWDFEIQYLKKDKFKIKFELIDKFNDGFPGDIKFCVNWSFKIISNYKYKIELDINAIPSEITPINITYHPYFNLSGHCNGDIADHKFKIKSDFIEKLDDQNIATGEPLNIIKSDYNLNQFKEFKLIKMSKNIAIQKNKGIDNHYFIGDLNKKKIMAQIKNNKNKLGLIVKSTLDGTQLYTGGNLNLKTGKNNCHYLPNYGFCIEPQFSPASLFQRGKLYPNTLFDSSNTYNHNIEYNFNFDIN